MEPVRWQVWGALVAALCLCCGGAESDGSRDDFGAIDSARQGIVGGYVDEATKGVLGLSVRLGDRTFGHCSGALIAPNLVLTARHCVALTGGTPDDFVECGVTRFTVQGSGDIFFVSTDTMRPQFGEAPRSYQGESVQAVPGANDICGFDMALIILNDSISTDEAVPLVPRIDEGVEPLEPFSATGYGLTEPDGFEAGVRMRTDDNTVLCAGPECITYRRDIIRDTEWVSLDARVCPGDSGGPALDSEGRVIGIASRGADGCDGVIYGAVAAWADFIIETAEQAAERGGYEPPFWTGGSSTPPLDVPIEERPPELDDSIFDTCFGPCAGGLACYVETGGSEGICVPRCSVDGAACPSDLVCSSRLGVCVPEDSADAPRDESGACTVSPRARRPPSAPGAWLALGVALLMARRRQRS